MRTAGPARWRARRIWVVVVAAMLASTAAAVSPVLTARASATTTVTFGTVGTTTFTVPAGVTSLSVTVTGAMAGRSAAPGGTAGGGAVVTGTLAVAPGNALTIYVAGAGTNGIAAVSQDAGGGTGGSGFASGGTGGGGGFVPSVPQGGGGGGGGGGASAITLATTPLVVAGGGGGGGGLGNASTSGVLSGGSGGSANSGGANGGTTSNLTAAAGGTCCSTVSQPGGTGAAAQPPFAATASNGGGGGGGGGYGGGSGGGGNGGAAGGAIAVLLCLGTDGCAGGAGAGGAGGQSWLNGGLFTPTTFNTGSINGGNGQVQISFPSATTTSLTQNSATSVQGSPVTFTATVSGSAGTPTGTVTFFANGVQFGGPVTLVGGVAQLTSSSLSVGSQSITAVYNGDSANAPSTSNGVTHLVSAAAPMLELVASASPVAVGATGQTVTYALTVTNTGNVTINNLSVTDTPTGPAGPAAFNTPPCAAVSLAVNGTTTCTGTYTASSADIASSSGEIVQMFTVSGTNAVSGGTVTSNPFSVSVDVRPPQPGFNAIVVNGTDTVGVS